MSLLPKEEGKLNALKIILYPSRHARFPISEEDNRLGVVIFVFLLKSRKLLVYPIERNFLKTNTKKNKIISADINEQQYITGTKINIKVSNYSPFLMSEYPEFTVKNKTLNLFN